jgi:DNA sulfur modification protein DndB
MPQFPFIELQQAEHKFKLTAIPADLLTQISYAAVRRQDEEVGAIQRVLITSRIAGIKEFAIKRGDFPASIVLNWIGPGLQISNGRLEINPVARSAQIIDGQHRVAGLKEAIREKPEIGTMLIPVAIYSDLDTQQSAKIFLSINTEQRPVPKSLVFDLYGIAGDELMDPAALRARDIVSALNDSGEPYEGLIKFPNQGYRRGGIALSTAVDTIKPLVEAKGVLEQIGVA